MKNIRRSHTALAMIVAASVGFLCGGGSIKQPLKPTTAQASASSFGYCKSAHMACKNNDDCGPGGRCTGSFEKGHDCAAYKKCQ